jgi:hypothetical protein
VLRLRLALLVALLALALASLLLPFAPLYDPWAWLVWGREAAGLELSTEAGPSWKPLPVAITTLAAPAGGAAPGIWLVAARLGWLAAVVLAWRLAARLVFPRRLATSLASWWAPERVRNARWVAGAVAATGVVLLFDPFTAWVRQFAGGLAEPLLVALVLGAIDRGLCKRPGQAFGLGVAAALLRPEVWPFLALYGVHLWAAEPRLRCRLIAGGLAVPVLWLVPDLIGSGDPLTGATRAREATGPPLGEAIEAIGRSLNLVLVGLWVSAAYAVRSARREGERAIAILAAGALGWIAVVALLSAAGYAGLPRFAAPAGAVGCVLGGVGVVRMVAAVGGMRDGGRRRIATTLIAILVATLAMQAGIRAAQIPGDLEDASDYASGVDDLSGLAGELGPERITGCGPASTTDFLTETALAWRLDLPLDRVALRVASAPPSGTAFVDADAPAAARRAVIARGSALGQRGSWMAYAISCTSASGADIAGVTGAAR